MLGVAAGKDRAAMPPKSDTKTPLLKDMQRQADEVVDLTRQNMEKVKDCILHHSRSLDFLCRRHEAQPRAPTLAACGVPHVITRPGWLRGVL